MKNENCHGWPNDHRKVILVIASASNELRGAKDRVNTQDPIFCPKKKGIPETRTFVGSLHFCGLLNEALELVPGSKTVLPSCCVRGRWGEAPPQPPAFPTLQLYRIQLSIQ